MNCSQFCVRDFHPVSSTFPVSFHYHLQSVIKSYNPDITEVISVWASPLSLATTNGIVSFPLGT